MKIVMERKGDILTVKLSGGLDTESAIVLEKQLLKVLEGMKTLNVDMEELAYISSDGWRMLFEARKVMNRQEYLFICHASRNVMEVFHVTGISDFLIFK